MKYGRNSFSISNRKSTTKTPFTRFISRRRCRPWDEFSFFSVCWSKIIIFFCNPRIRVEALMHCWCCCHFLLGIAKLPVDSIRKASKLLKSSLKHIVVKICCKTIWLSLSCSYINWRLLQHASCALALRFVLNPYQLN